MPELPEVETVCRGMEKALKGRVIEKVTTKRDGLRAPFPKNLKKELEGHKADHFNRRGKYILMRLDSHKVLILHLGMTGRILLVPPSHPHKAQKHDHLILEFDDGSAMVFNDARRFGMVMLANDNELEAHKAFKGLGPEPLDNHFSAPVLFEKLKNKKTSVKAALMDQRVVAGLGNIYVCEALFYAGIDPRRKACTITKAESEKLVRAIRGVLRKAIKAGGSTLKDYRQAGGELGYFQHSFVVYDRKGETCPQCRSKVHICHIKKIKQGGRSTYYCPQTQK